MKKNLQKANNKKQIVELYMNEFKKNSYKLNDLI